VDCPVHGLEPAQFRKLARVVARTRRDEIADGVEVSLRDTTPLADRWMTRHGSSIGFSTR
jgi:hypothetical protein